MKNLNRWILVGLAFFVWSDRAALWAQLDPQVLQELKTAQPRAQYYGDQGVTRAIFGTVLSEGSTPLDSAWNYLDQWGGLFGQDTGVLFPDVNANGEVLQGVMYDPAAGRHKLSTFRFQQYYEGLPVFRSGIGFLVRNEANYPLVLTGFNIKDMADFDVHVDAGAKPEVTAAMLDHVRQWFDANVAERGLRPLQFVRPLDIQVSDEELVLWAGTGPVTIQPEMAVVFVAQRGDVTTFPDYQKMRFVASVATGEILLAETMIHNVDVTGTVRGNATNGIRAAECDPETSMVLPHAEVAVVGGNTAFANATGSFVIPHGGTTQVTVRSYLRGRYFEVFDQGAGNTTPFIDIAATPPGPVNFLHNPTAGQQFPTANVNAYREANVIRDYVLSYEPAFPVIATQLSFNVNTNINSTCNAFYDGASINFYRSGGGCNNTAFSDVVYHEYGHHLIDVTDNGQGQMGEGSGDVMGVLIQDEPILGHGFDGVCTSGIRTANNTIQYPCSGGSHSCGQLLSGCVWDTRNALILTEPTNYRNISASLFLGMLIVRGQMEPGNSTITPFITILYLELDDDDGDIGNGTPHYQEIAAGFGAHNMDAPPLDLVDFEYPTGRPELISPAGGVAFTVRVVGVAGTPQPGTGVLHVNRGSGFESFPMSQVSSNLYQANFPTSTCGSELRYYVTAQTTNSSTVADPETAPDAFYTATSGDQQVIVFSDNFQTNLGWTVSGNATDGQWQRGVPAGGGDRGDPPTDADGSGSCYVTDNADGNSDVDNGNTILTSPLLNAAAGANEETVISYYRWYSNVEGSSPEQDTFLVEISGNGGATWTNVEVVGPTGPEVQGGWVRRSFRIRDIINPTSQMRVRFTASDTDPQSVVEAGVDGFQLKRVSCDVTTVVTVDDVDVLRGIHVQGAMSDLDTSNNVRLCYQKGITPPNQPGVQLELTGLLPDDSPSSLKIVIESQTDTNQITQKVEMFNFDTNQYEQVDSRNTSVNTDATAQIQLAGDVTRFAQPGTGAVMARVSYSPGPLGGRGRFIVCLDQFVWEAE